MTANRQIIRITLLISTVFIALSGCKFKDTSAPGHGNRPSISFKSIEGIYYTEVDRRKKDGLSFNDYGYHLSPEWKIRFVSDDSAALYSPVKKQYLNFPLARGVDSIFNTGRAFLKMRHMSKDSLIFEMLEAKNDSLEVGGSKVYMKFYADNYIKNVLHADPWTYRIHNKKDSTYISGLAAKANADIKKAFAALQPVQLISKSSQVTVSKRKAVPNSLDNNFNTSDDYMDPTFDITINKAYQDFQYSFSVYVDAKGNMIFRRALIDLSDDHDFEKHYIKMATGIMNSYLKLYLQVIPGQTLGIPHTSAISINVRGIAKAK